MKDENVFYGWIISKKWPIDDFEWDVISEFTVNFIKVMIMTVIMSISGR